VQPSIPQSEKWQAANADAIFRKLLDLSASPGAGGKGLSGVTHLIWPETAFPFFLTQRPDALGALASLLPPGTSLIAGAARTDPAPAPGREPPVYNSIYVIDDEGEIDGAYDKVHLVPFGEYLPFQSFLESFGLRQLTQIVGGFSAGSAHRLLRADPAPAFAPLICYEAIFPAEAVPPGSRPAWLVNVTNDAWYGNTPGPRQHLRQATLRAVEQGLPLVRAANNGISAVVDPYGRPIARLELNAVSVLDSGLPRALAPTIYARYGDAIPALVVILATVVALFGRVKERT
jgi:apolipoprotein N-acyltransferase